MARPGGADDVDAELANPIRAETHAGLPRIRNSIGEDWGSAVDLAGQLEGRLRNLTPVNGSDDADVSELRREVKALAAKVEELAADINELREAVTKTRDMEEKNWVTNNKLLDKLYKAVVLERQPREIQREQQTTTTRNVAPARGSAEKPVSLVRKLFCMG